VSAPLRPAEQIAREMVPEPIEQSGSWFVVVRDGEREITLASWRTRAEVDEDRDDARAIIARLIEQRDAEHAAAERERAEQQAQIALYPAPDVSGQWIAHHKHRDVVTQGNSEPHALRMLAEAIEIADGSTQPRDLAGRIRGVSADNVLCAAQRNGVQGCGPDKLLFSREDYDDPPEEQEARILAAETRATDELEAIVRSEVKP
jgi:hypothetical protein